MGVRGGWGGVMGSVSSLRLRISLPERVSGNLGKHCFGVVVGSRETEIKFQKSK